jgi:Fe-Mn family superoxide dismutase
MYILPTLPYSYDAFGKYISKDTVLLHYSKHHQAYVDKLNNVLDTVLEVKNKPLEYLLSHLEDVPEVARVAVCNFGGGHYNHTFFWQCLSPDSNGEPNGELKDKLIEKYGSFQSFIEKFATLALSVFGSGWTWLLADLEVITTPNQDTPMIQGLSVPILCLDVWEHAYYLDYKNKRDDYIKAWWSIVNWEFAAHNYTESVAR